MARSGLHREIEIKLRLRSAAAGRRILKQAGFRQSRRRVFESNTVFDTPQLDLRRTGVLLRVRQAGRRSLLTYKGPAAPGKHKSREELEIAVPDAGGMELILERLGFQPVFRYQKFRTEFAQPDARGVVLLDRTPIGCFLELEGPPRWIDRTARTLGFPEADYITATYAQLYFDFCNERGVPPGDMVFAARRRR